MRYSNASSDVKTNFRYGQIEGALYEAEIVVEVHIMKGWCMSKWESDTHSFAHHFLWIYGGGI